MIGSVAALLFLNPARLEAPIGERMARYGLTLVGRPYVGKTLDQNPEREVCTVRLDGLDCVTFMEVSLAMARSRSTEVAKLKREITFTRYRGGKVNGYLSRLHYTSDWISDNVAKKVVTNLTPKLPGTERFYRRLDFMSTHPGSYPALVAQPALLPELVQIEKASSEKQMWFLAKASVAAAESRLRSGDIIAITVGGQGIDCSHVGMIIEQGGVKHFVHASSAAKKVIIDGTISSYLNRIKSSTGIMVARPLEKRRG